LSCSAHSCAPICAAYDESEANYRQTILTALQEVEDNLATLRILDDEAKAQQGLKLTEDDVKHGIEEGQAGVEAASADLVLAQQEVGVGNEVRSAGFFKKR